ncbi:MAG: acetylornithine deacetylase [Sandaracinaceae bacterium]|nr:acetylornithine deacetylase [Sandaracinaceae bacterium]
MSGPPLREAIERLIATPSVSAVDPARDQGNRGLVEMLGGWLAEDGFAVEILPLPGDESRKANLIATRGRGEGGLVLAGHTDTVPFDEGRWSSDPFRATERDGKLYGLGTSDMKSFLALAMEAARSFDERELRRPLVILGTADEESGMDGARALVAAGKPRARHAVIGEPTGLRPVRMHKGCAMERLELTGKSGHSSDPRHGISALDAMHDAIGELMAVREELARAHRRDELEPPVPTLNLGRIEGGDNPNRICASCTLDYDVRLLPGMRMDAVRSAILSRVQERLRGRGVGIRSRALVTEVEPFETDPSAALVRAAEALTGHAAEAVSFGTEAPFLTELGAQTIVLGPGDIAVAHQPDEHLPLDRIEPMLSILRSLIRRFCVEESPP